MLIRTSGINIPYNHELFESIELSLNRNIRGWNEVLTNMKFYQETEEGILIPRFYPLNEDVYSITDDGDSIEVESNIIPRNKRQENSIDFLIDNDCGILKLEPGSGKNVISIAAMSHIKKRTIIFVHKDSLMNQWKDEIIKHTNLSESDISRLSSSSYKDDFKKPIILSTVQTVLKCLSSDKKEDFIFYIQNSGLGLAFFDECHTTVGPEQFSKVSICLKCKRIHGLSATPQRTDGNDDIIRWHLGNIKYFEAESNELLKPKIYMMYFPHDVYNKKRIKYLTWGGSFNISRYQSQLYKSESYISTCCNIIRKLYNQGKNILVLGVRTEYLLKIAKECNISKSEIGIFIPSAASNETVSRKTKKKVKKYNISIDEVSDIEYSISSFLDKRIIFSTYLACRDGNNRKDLDALVMTYPTSNPIQAIGRILRVPDDGKEKNAIVIDLVDTQGPNVIVSKDSDEYDDENKKGQKLIKWFKRSAIKRKIFYKENNWDFEVIKLKIEPNNAKQEKV